MDDIGKLCTICAHNINNDYCEVENDSFNENTFYYKGDCEDFALEQYNRTTKQKQLLIT